MSKIGLNGFGRIGRLVLRAAHKRHVKISAINEPNSTPEHMAYLMKFNSVYGRFREQIGMEQNELVVDGEAIKLLNESSPDKMQWSEIGVSYIIDTTGEINTMEQANKLLKPGVDRIVVAGLTKDIPTFICGANLEQMEPDLKVISNGCPTLNALAPMAKLINEKFIIKEAFLTIFRDAKNSSQIVSNNPKTWKEGRSTSSNIVASPLTDAIETLERVLPDLSNKIGASSYRVASANVSAIDMVVRTKHSASWDYMKALIKEASLENLKGILGYTPHEVVSSDFLGDPHSITFDVNSSMALNENFFKLVGWYDNEWAYANRLIDLALYSILADAKLKTEDNKRKMFHLKI